MKISMWMIANRLSAFDPELHIRENAPITLKSARRAYATNCVQVFQMGSDVICNGEGDYIRLRDMSCEQAIELVQSIFDFYDDWSSTIRSAAERKDFKRLIDECWHVFHNPIIFLDANCKALALSSQYGENEVDNEWRYLCRYGYSSVMAVNSYSSTYQNEPMLSTKPSMFRSTNAVQSDCLSVMLVSEHTVCGRINILETDRKLNSGDMQLLGYLADIVTSAMSSDDPDGAHVSTRNIFYDLIKGEKKPIDYESLDYQLQYLGWSRTDRLFVVALIPRTSLRQELLMLVSNLLSSQLPNSTVIVIENHVCAIFNESKISAEQVSATLRPIAVQNKLYMGISLPVDQISSLGRFYNQAVAAVEYGKLYGSGEDVYSFYDYALDYIIEADNVLNVLHACHPDVVHIWRNDNDSSSDKMTTLRSYLNNERSLVNTAQELFVHRNTLVYRIKKITDLMQYDINDIYTRDYMKMSIRVLDLLTSKYVIEPDGEVDETNLQLRADSADAADAAVRHHSMPRLS